MMADALTEQIPGRIVMIDSASKQAGESICREIAADLSTHFSEVNALLDSVTELNAGSHEKETVSRRGDPGVRDDITLCLVEALNNIAQHGTPTSETPVVTARARVDDDVLTVSLRDNVRPMPLEARQHHGSCSAPPAGDLPESGWGIFLMRQIARDITVDTDETGNTLTLVFDMIPT